MALHRACFQVVVGQNLQQCTAAAHYQQDSSHLQLNTLGVAHVLVLAHGQALSLPQLAVTRKKVDRKMMNVHFLDYIDILDCARLNQQSYIPH